MSTMIYVALIQEAYRARNDHSADFLCPYGQKLKLLSAAGIALLIVFRYSSAVNHGALVADRLGRGNLWSGRASWRSPGPVQRG
jgi:hypothetical protein